MTIVDQSTAVDREAAARARLIAGLREMAVTV